MKGYAMKRLLELDSWLFVLTLFIAGLVGWMIRDASAVQHAEIAEYMREGNVTRSKNYAHDKESLRLNREIHDHLKKQCTTVAR